VRISLSVFTSKLYTVRMQTIPVANSVLWQAYRKKADADLTPIRVQKLMYFLHGWYTTIVGTPLLDEAFVRGKFGPVLPSLERELQRYAGVPVDDYIRQLNPDTAEMVPFFVNEKHAPQFLEILLSVWSQYSALSTAQLSTLSHAWDSPWAKTAAGQPISNELIVEDFRRRAAESQERSAARA